mmetsp:Transcript_44179/g.91987  ORF Transcript_44179/g.91987 Transcript_44179/m.91987 type:complete len:433 (-) Transcript_44179:2024-3322(-)
MLPRQILRHIVAKRAQHGSSSCCRLLFSTKNDGRSGSVGDYFNSLRWKAAEALTSTLPEEERSLLLGKLSTPGVPDNAVKSDDGASQATASEEIYETTATSHEPSIDEAIAATKLQEAERYEEKWKREKETLIAEAEEAARSRIESAIEIQKRQMAFEAWQSELEHEKNNDGFSDSVPLIEDKLKEHPVLGQMVADLGYKRIHLASAKNLATIPIWKKQRIYRHGRSKNMAADKMKTLHLGLPGIIGIFEKVDGSLNIIDGQHRIGMLKMMQDKISGDGFDFENILVEVFPAQEDQSEDSQPKEIFLEVNKAEPVKLVDLPGVAKAKDRNIINEVAERLREKFPEMFSESQRCRSPHLNVDNLRDALFASKIIEKHSLKTSKALEEWILERNEILATEFQEEENRKLVSANALKKAERLQFYLGLDSSWLYK